MLLSAWEWVSSIGLEQWVNIVKIFCMLCLTAAVRTFLIAYLKPDLERLERLAKNSRDSFALAIRTADSSQKLLEMLGQKQTSISSKPNGEHDETRL